MDWSKAKNILIIAFVVTNLLLFYVLWQNQTYNGSYINLEKGFVEDVKALLLDKDIKIDSPIPKEVPSMTLLDIEYETYDTKHKREELVNKFFDDYQYIQEDGKDFFIKDNESIHINNNKEIVYENKNDEERFSNIDLDTSKSIAMEFLENNSIYDEDLVLSEVKELKQGYMLEYTKVFQDILVEKSYMKFTIDNRGVREFRRIWMYIVDYNDKEIMVRSAPDALLRLVSNEQVYGKTISDISICYYFNPKEHEMVDIKDTKRANAVPAWRVEFSDGTKVFLEEY